MLRWTSHVHRFATVVRVAGSSSSSLVVGNNRTLLLLRHYESSYSSNNTTTTKTTKTPSESTRDKLRRLFQEYANANYTQTIPSRIVKDILEAADVDHSGTISVQEVQGLLRNVQSKETFTNDELKEWMHETYNVPVGTTTSTTQVPVAQIRERMLEILQENNNNNNKTK